MYATELAPQQSKPTATAAENAESSAQLLKRAEQAEREGAYAEAEACWQRYITVFPGEAEFDHARYHRALCLFHLGRYEDSSKSAASVIQDQATTALGVDARILLAEDLLQTGKTAEALALTYEVLPDTRAERASGLKRQSDSAIQPSLIQKIKNYTLRGRILASLNRPSDAAQALKKAQVLLEGSSKMALSDHDRLDLAGRWALRQIETLSIQCSTLAPRTQRLSEAEFLAYADVHYRCADPTRELFCKVIRTYRESHDEQLKSLALTAYRGLVEAPLALLSTLPPPAREIRTQDQRKNYESEMKALIEKTVRERSQPFRNLSACNSFDVF
jgi:tetratricopeptide (TPR) repeat protein